MNTIKSSAICTILASAMLCGCSSNEWTPGPAEPESNAGVFFTTDNPSYSTVVIGEDHTINLNMKRINTEQEAIVPLQIEVTIDGEPASDNAGMQFPSTVTFAKGNDSAVYNINVDNMTPRKAINFNIKIAPEYVHTYAAGISEYSGEAMASIWDSYNTSFVIYDNASTYTTPYKEVTGVMEHFRGSNMYRIPNFLNSEFTFRYSIVDLGYGSSYDDGTKTYAVIPQENNYVLMTDIFDGWEDYGDHPYLLYDKETDFWPSFNLLDATTGDPVTLYYPLISQYFDNSYYCSYLSISGNGEGNFGWINFYAFYDMDMQNYTPYLYVCWFWDQITE